jgi:hypothetical protein
MFVAFETFVEYQLDFVLLGMLKLKFCTSMEDQLALVAFSILEYVEREFYLFVHALLLELH